MAKKARTRTKVPQDAPPVEPAAPGTALGDLFAERVKAMAARLEEIMEEASVKGRERIKPMMEKLLAKWHEMKGEEPTARATTPAAPITAKRKRAPQKKRTAKPAKKAAKGKSTSTGKVKRPGKTAKKKS
jgi:hypothetical protein